MPAGLVETYQFLAGAGMPGAAFLFGWALYTNRLWLNGQVQRAFAEYEKRLGERDKRIDELVKERDTWMRHALRSTNLAEWAKQTSETSKP